MKTFYDANTGKILAAVGGNDGWHPSIPGASVLDGYFDPELYRVVNGAPVRLPPRPSALCLSFHPALSPQWW